MMVRCEVCGTTRNEEKMITRRLNNRSYYCCGINCEVKWEKINLIGVCG